MAQAPAQPQPVVGPAGHTQLLMVFDWTQVDVYITEHLKDTFQDLLPLFMIVPGTALGSMWLISVSPSVL